MGARYKPGDPDFIPADITDHDRDIKPPAYGWMSLFFLLVSGALAYTSYHYVTEALCNLGDATGGNLNLSALSGLGSLLTVMVALTLAGAGLATNRGNVGALFTLVLTFAPLIILAVGLIYGWSPDFSSADPVITTNPNIDLANEGKDILPSENTCSF